MNLEPTSSTLRAELATVNDFIVKLESAWQKKESTDLWILVRDAKDRAEQITIRLRAAEARDAAEERKRAADSRAAHELELTTLCANADERRMRERIAPLADQFVALVEKLVSVQSEITSEVSTQNADAKRAEAMKRQFGSSTNTPHEAYAGTGRIMVGDAFDRLIRSRGGIDFHSLKALHDWIGCNNP